MGVSIVSPCTWYIIHHCTSSKFCVVMNVTTRFQGEWINDSLLKDPEHTRGLLGVLLHFRQYRFGFMADIESLYLQCRVPAVDQSSLKFLRFDQGDLHRPVVDMRMTSQAV